MEPGRPATSPSLDERTLRLAVGALGALHLLVGAYMLLAPASFYFRIGRYGVENTHYVGDLGAFVIAFGIALLLAVGRPAWRAPLLAFGAIYFLFHGLNHLFDIGEARSDARGVLDTVIQFALALFLGWLATAAERLRGEGPAGQVGSLSGESRPRARPRPRR